MKICFISREIFPFFYGGIGTQVYAQMHYLLSQKHNIYFLTEKPDNFCQSDFDLKYQGIKVIFVNRDENEYILHDSLNYAFSLEKIFETVDREYQIDLVFLSDYSAEGLFILLKKNQGKYRNIFLLELQGASYECLKYNSAIVDGFFTKVSAWEKVQCYAENLCISLADRLLSPSQIHGSETIQRLGFNREFSVIPNSPNLEIFQLREPSIKELSSIKTIVYAGRLEKRKGVDLLLASFMSILNDNIEIELKLVLLGRDLYWEEYGESFQSHWQKIIPNIFNDRIEFLGHCSQETLKNYFSNAWVAVFPSRWEPFGNVCLEAIASGCPVIVTKDTGLMEVVGADYDVFFDRTEGVEGLKSVLHRVLKDVGLRNHLAKKSWIRAREMSDRDGKLILEYIDSLDTEVHNSVKMPELLELTNLQLMFEEYTKLERYNRDELKKQQSWTDELQNGKNWLEEQYHTWMKVAQTTQLQLDSTQAQLLQIRSQLSTAQTQILDIQPQLDTAQTQLFYTRSQLDIERSQLIQAQAQLATERDRQIQTQLELDATQTQLHRTQIELETSQSQIINYLVIITELQNSLFWKLRNQWLKLKNIFS